MWIYSAIKSIKIYLFDINDKKNEYNSYINYDTLLIILYGTPIQYFMGYVIKQPRVDIEDDGKKKTKW